MERAFEAPDLIEVMDEAVRYNRFLLDQLTVWGDGARRILDFGAGNGRFALALRERGFNVHAVEPDPCLRARIAAGGVPTYDGLDVMGELRFDAVYSINVLEHIEDDLAALRALRKRVDLGGRLLLYVPAFAVLYSANDERVGHVRRYTRSSLIGAVRQAGFKIEAARYVDSIGFLAGLLYRLAGNRDGGLNVTMVRLYDRAVFPISRCVDRALDRFIGKNLLLRAVRWDTVASGAPGSG